MRYYQLGPSLKSLGGIASVEKIYRDKVLDKLQIKQVSTYTTFNKPASFMLFIISIIRVAFLCIIHYKNVCFHIHTASRGSFLRKKILSDIITLFNGKYLIHLHGGEFDIFYNESKEQKKEQIVSYFNNSECVIVLTEYWITFMKTIGVTSRLVKVFNICEFLQLNHKNSTSHKKVKFLFTGRLSRKKGIYDLIDAFHASDNQAFLDIYGTGELEDLKKHLQNYTGLEERVRIRGWIDQGELIEKIHSYDVFILPSYVEGLPMSILEAAGAGLPVIATNVGGIPEIINHGVNGFLTEPGNTEELTQFINYFIENKDKIVEMGHANYRNVKENFSLEKIKTQINNLYKELFGV